MSVEIIYTCDICGEKGHASQAPSEKCIKALKKRIEELILEAYRSPYKQADIPEWPKPNKKFWMGI